MDKKDSKYSILNQGKPNKRPWGLIFCKSISFLYDYVHNDLPPFFYDKLEFYYSRDNDLL